MSPCESAVPAQRAARWRVAASPAHPHPPRGVILALFLAPESPFASRTFTALPASVPTQRVVPGAAPRRELRWAAAQVQPRAPSAPLGSCATPLLLPDRTLLVSRGRARGCSLLRGHGNRRGRRRPGVSLPVSLVRQFQLP